MVVLAYLALLGRILLLGVERIVVKKLGHKADSVSGAFLFFAIAAVLLSPVLAFVPMPTEFGFLKYAAFSSLVYAFAFWLYVKSLSEGEASLVSPLYNFNVFFLLILTVIFLNESLSIFKIIGLVFLVYGASFLNKQKNILLSLKSLFTNKACLYMIITSFLIAIGRTIDGFVVQSIHPVVYAFSIYVGISLFLLIYQIPTKSFKNTINLLKSKPKIAIASGAINSYSFLFLLFAFKEIEVSIAEPASMLGMLVTVFLAGRIFKENIKERLIGVLIMIVGAWLLFL